MKKKKLSKDELSIDDTPNRHKWVLGTWNRVLLHNERVDTCRICNCKRTTISYKVLDKTFTEVSSYQRSGVTMPGKPAPLCWGANNPQ